MSDHHAPPSGLKLWWIKFIYRNTMPCTHVTRLLSQAQDRPLSLSQRLKLRVHFWVCVFCQRYGEQLKFLREAAPHAHEHSPPIALLPPDARNRMKAALRQTGH